MSCSVAEDFGPPQVHPGTILRVQEGQNCAVLCAADEETGAFSSRASNYRTPWRQRQPPDACHGTNSPTCAAHSDCSRAQQQQQQHSQQHPYHPAGSTGGASSGRSGGGALDATSDADAAAATAVVCLDDEEDGDGATATAGDGSSALVDDDDTETSFSELSDPGGTEVVFVREGVAVWPGARSERILGRLSLVKQCGVLFMAWLPYSRGVLQADGTFRVVAADADADARDAHDAKMVVAKARGRVVNGGGAVGATGTAAEAAMPPPPPTMATSMDGQATATGHGSDRTLYAVHPIPLSEVRALRRRTPPLGLGCPQLLVVLTSGVTLPPLHFTRGGVRALIATLKQHVFLLKSASEPQTYLVNDTADPLCRSLSALQLADVLIGGPPPGASATFEPGGAALFSSATAFFSSSSSAMAAATVPSEMLATGAAVAGGSVSQSRAAWASPATGLGLAAAAGLGGGGACAAASGGGAGGGSGRDVGALQSGVAWSWADRPARRTESGDLGGFEAVDGSCGGGDGDGGGEGNSQDYEDGSSEGYRGVVGGAWASSIVDAINRFVQNVKGTASGWIGALDELEESEGDLLYGGESDCYNLRCTVDVDDRTGGENPTAEEKLGRCQGGIEMQRRCGGIADGDAVSGVTGSGSSAAATTSTACLASGTAQNSNTRGEGIPPSAADAAASAAAGTSTSGTNATRITGLNPRNIGSGGNLEEAGDITTAVGDFELLDGSGCWGEASAHPLLVRRRLRPPPLSAEEWAAMFDAEGRLVAEAALRDRVSASGCCPELRREVWKHLLAMYPRGSTAAERRRVAQAWQRDYLTLRSQWQSMTPAQEARCTAWRAARTAVDKDVRRTDRGHPFFAREGGPGLRALRHVLLTHVMYDQDLGYCQGMSDMAAPLLVVMRDEAEAFWALAALLEGRGMRGNFHTDMEGMNAQLAALRRLVQLLDPPLHAYLERRDCLSYYFAFRWLLIHFKREFKFEEVLSLWEACWACRRTRHLHLYLAAAVLVRHRRVILSSELDHDGLLRLCLGLGGRLELGPLLETAEALAGYAGEAGREVTQGLA
ncbi:hypothetical protein Agub_g3981 [Astrephomene gubernaculifera]|uniref:Rab-GAP TBC domain-containing protein n=1 Tax=Astrephomene gubernaculifera TaxID=47775 RepID=A0AAD3HJD5_9CHLO|nr:hypothetical protein Agub_g3981 [Astrephomene gubernaculifera]